MRAFGITGGIGAGKSLVARIFEILGIAIYDADTRARAIMNDDLVVIKAIRQLFGKESYRLGQLDRTVVAQRAFHDPTKLSALNAIVHPAVAKDFEQWLIRQSGPYVLKEAALLYEAGSYKGLEEIIVVDAPKELRVERVLLRDPHRDAVQVEAIMEKQMDNEQKVDLADVVITNDGKSPLIPQVLAIHQRFCAQTLTS
ncbi:MAG: dephospho-CoA kinase [Bacteroidota bacterium]